MSAAHPVILPSLQGSNCSNDTECNLLEWRPSTFCCKVTNVQNPIARFSNIVLRRLSFAIVNRHILADVHFVGGVIHYFISSKILLDFICQKLCKKGCWCFEDRWDMESFERFLYLLGACNVLAGSLLSVVHLSHLNRTYYLNTSTLQHLSHLNRTPTLLPPTSLNCSSLRETQRHLDPYTILPPQTK